MVGAMTATQGTKRAGQMSPLSRRVAVEIKVAMARAELNQLQVTALLGHDGTWLSKRLSGVVKMTLDDLAELAPVLHVTPVELLGAATPESDRKVTGDTSRRNTGKRRHLYLVAS